MANEQTVSVLDKPTMWTEILDHVDMVRRDFVTSTITSPQVMLDLWQSLNKEVKG